MQRTLKERTWLFAKGIAMGAADVVPGVSGGTIAFITGIYEELLGSIRSVDGKALKKLFSGDLRGFWRHINGGFLLVLFVGIGVAVVSLSRVILYFLENTPEMLWAFFFGLIVASALVVGRKVGRWSVGTVAVGLFGVAAAYLITELAPAETPTALWFIFLSGAVAICAMILPGVSGSFLLVLMGKYEYVLGAVKALDFGVILTFMGGCLVGLLSFSRLLKWMLERHYDLTVALLTGFMVGSLNKVWPWKQTLQTYMDRHGVVKPLVQQNVLPTDYQSLTGQAPHLWEAILLAVFGFALVYFIERITTPTQPTPAVEETV
ncbi:MAG: DUF368 domain-containing protein [Catalinimonas sp.]